MSLDENNVYGSGINLGDWHALNAFIVPHYAFRDGEFVPPTEITVAPLPSHLVEHPIAELVRKNRATGNSMFLDEAGQLLVPRNELWWLIITKS
jgi:hypothetical protein